MGCSTCDDSGKTCVVCSQSKTDCVCSDEDIQEYIEEEEIDPQDFEQYQECEDCDGD